MRAPRRLLLLALYFGVALTAESAYATSRDHLECRRIGDSNEETAVVDLTTLPFGLDADCTVRARAREVCVPASPDVFAAGSENAGSVPAAEIAQERICYRIDCPRRALPPAVATDRFGTRRIALRGPRLFCTPVSLEAPAP
jgi:hypothetical protein